MKKLFGCDNCSETFETKEECDRHERQCKKNNDMLIDKLFRMFDGQERRIEELEGKVRELECRVESLRAGQFPPVYPVYPPYPTNTVGCHVSEMSEEELSQRFRKLRADEDVGCDFVSWFSEESSEGEMIGGVHDSLKTFSIDKVVDGIDLSDRPEDYGFIVDGIVAAEREIVEQAKKEMELVWIVHIDSLKTIEAVVLRNPQLNGTSLALFMRFAVVGLRKREEER